jgi:hypothetical protein
MNCSEAEAMHRLIKGVDMPAPPQRKPAFAEIVGEPPDSQHTAPAKKPIFVQVKEAFDKDKAAFDEEIASTLGMGEWRGQVARWRAIKKHPLGATPTLLATILCLSFAPLLVYLHLSETVGLTTTALACAILAGLWFGIYANYQRVADETWMDAAKENIQIFFGLMFVIFAMHGAAAYSFFGFDFTFVAFAVLAALAAVGHMTSERA